MANQHDAADLAALSEATKLEKTSSRDASSNEVEQARITKQDDHHAGDEFPTDDELKTLRRITDTIPWNAYRQLSFTALSPRR